VFAQILSDMDSLGKDGNTVGLLGGVIGELLIILSTLEDFKSVEHEEDPLFALRALDITTETVQKIVDYIVGELVSDGKIEIGVTGDIEAQLVELDSDFTLDNIHTKPSYVNDLRELLRSSINSFVLRVIEENCRALHLREEYIEIIVDAFINIILSPDEKGRKIKLIKAPTEYNEEVKFQAVAVLMPSIDDSPLFNLAEAKGIKPKKGGKKESLQNLDAKEEEEEEIVDIAEIDYDDVVSVFPLGNEELRVLVHQAAVSIVFRREVLLFISTIFKELDMKEIEVLKKVNAKAVGVEDLVANQFAKNLPVLTFDRN